MRNWKKLLMAAGLVGAAPVTMAGDVHGISANVALTTDYIYRGISQTNEDFAIQGGFDYEYKPWGVYLGVWASNLEFAAANPPATDPASIEIDIYGGIAGEFSNGLGWDIGGLYYAYPSQNEDAAGDFDFFEVYGGLSYTVPNVSFEPAFGLNVAYSPDFFGETGDAIYINGSAGLTFGAFGVSGELGWQDIDQGLDYLHWRLGVSAEYKSLGFDLSYHDAEDDACGGGKLCDARVVFTISASLDLF